MMLEQICCVVSVSDTSCTQKQRNPLSCSGVVLNHRSGFVLCSGALFSNFLIDKHCINTNSNILGVNNFHNKMHVSIHHTDMTMNQGNTSGHPACHQPAELFMMINCIEFQVAFQNMFTEADKWNFYNGDEEAETLFDPSFLSWFAVLKLSTGTHGQIVPWVKSTTLEKGQSVLVCGSPFGSFCPDLFMNTLSKGIVSNAAGQENALILTDARCLPGTEGGGVFVNNGDMLYLVGLIVSPLCWKSNELIGLTLVCSFHLILKNILQSVTSHQSPREILPDSLKNNSQADAQQRTENGLYPTVVLVESGQQWGSGIMLSPRLVLTCRHVVDGKTFLKVTFNSGQRFCTVNGDVLYSSNASSPYDVAVVQLQKPLDVVVPQLTKSFHPGEDVLVLSYGALGKTCGPSLTSGILSRVISLRNKPVMLQTTCAVQCGASGGAVIRAKTGELLGIVSSNTRDFTAKVTYPHLNFSIPVSVLEPLLRSFAQTGDSAVFLSLDCAEEEVSRVWRLQGSQSKL